MLDAGIPLARLLTGHRAHADATELLDRCVAGKIDLVLSVVNLSEVIQHARASTQQAGLDPVAFLEGQGVRFHTPDVEVAKIAAEFAHLRDASLADRFAVASAQVLGARLYTTDRSLANALRRTRIPVTVF